MAAPAFFDVQQEADRVDRAIPEMTRRVESLREQQIFAERLRAEIISYAAQIIGNCDHICESLGTVPTEQQAEVASILERTERHRQEAFELMEQYNPEQAWFWAEGKEVPEGTREHLPPPSRPLPVINDVALDAAYAEMAADEDYEREALVWISHGDQTPAAG
jgi:hypothetical protein